MFFQTMLLPQHTIRFVCFSMKKAIGFHKKFPARLRSNDENDPSDLIGTAVSKEL